MNWDAIGAVGEILGALAVQPYYEAYAEALEITADDAARSDWTHAYFFWLHWGQWSTNSDDAGKAELEHMIRSYYTVPAVRYLGQ